MIELKSGVRLEGVKPETVLAIMVAQSVFVKAGHKFTVTSISDGKHRKGSFHYSGFAFDIRTWADNHGTQLPDRIKEFLAQKLRDALGEEFDVVVEATHIHVEMDVRR